MLKAMLKMTRWPADRQAPADVANATAIDVRQPTSCVTALYAMSQLRIIARRVGRWESGDVIDRDEPLQALPHPVVNFEADVALQPSGNHARWL